MRAHKLNTFKIDVAEEVLSDLQRRLLGTRWSYQIEGTGWDSGTAIDYLKDLVGYWQKPIRLARTRASAQPIRAFQN
jgi:Epoxide hydrolase N terminus